MTRPKDKAEAYALANTIKVYWFTADLGLELALTRDDAASVSHAGSCDDDVAELRRVPYVAEQLADFDAEQLWDYLRGYGAWDDDELADHDANLSRFLWIAGGGITQEQTP